MKLAYTTKEAVDITNINCKKLYLLRDMGILTPIMMGKKFLWSHKDLEEFIEWSQGLDLTNEVTIKQALINKPRKERK